MSHLNTIGVDLAKNIIQVSLVSVLGKELRNTALTRTKFAEFLARQKQSLVAFEACATAHHWARVAKRHGHEKSRRRLLRAVLLVVGGYANH